MPKMLYFFTFKVFVSFISIFNMRFCILLNILIESIFLSVSNFPKLRKSNLVKGCTNQIFYHMAI